MKRETFYASPFALHVLQLVVKHVPFDRNFAGTKREQDERAGEEEEVQLEANSGLTNGLSEGSTMGQLHQKGRDEHFQDEVGAEPARAHADDQEKSADGFKQDRQPTDEFGRG